MTFTLDRVVPWGRSCAEYRAMFELTDTHLSKRILGCGDGPSSFNAEASESGATVVSVDPIYAFSRAEIQSRIEATYAQILEQTRKNLETFVWERFKSVDELGQARMQAMNRFLDDYDKGRNDGRYRVAELPRLPFAEREFELALCSHFLFLYSQQLGEQFHIDSVLELCRVATEVRVFPLLNLAGEPAPAVAKVVETLESKGIQAEIVTVGYEFQRGGNTMLRISQTP